MAALAITAAAHGATTVPVSKLKSTFKKSTGQTLVLDKLTSASGRYWTFNLGVQTAERRARYGSFTIYLVTNPDVETEVTRLLSNTNTGELGQPSTGGIYWQQGRNVYGEDYWQARKRYGSNIVLYWIGLKPVKKVESSFTTLHKALLAATK